MSTVRKLKYSCDLYRMIKGVKYQGWSSEPECFPAIIKEIKAAGLRYRIIGYELFREVKRG